MSNGPLPKAEHKTARKGTQKALSSEPLPKAEREVSTLTLPPNHKKFDPIAGYKQLYLIPMENYHYDKFVNELCPGQNAEFRSAGVDPLADAAAATVQGEGDMRLAAIDWYLFVRNMWHYALASNQSLQGNGATKPREDKVKETIATYFPKSKLEKHTIFGSLDAANMPPRFTFIREEVLVGTGKHKVPGNSVILYAEDDQREGKEEGRYHLIYLRFDASAPDVSVRKLFKGAIQAAKQQGESIMRSVATVIFWMRNKNLSAELVRKIMSIFTRHAFRDGIKDEYLLAALDTCIVRELGEEHRSTIDKLFLDRDNTLKVEDMPRYIETYAGTMKSLVKLVTKECLEDHTKFRRVPHKTTAGNLLKMIGGSQYISTIDSLNTSTWPFFLEGQPILEFTGKDFTDPTASGAGAFTTNDIVLVRQLTPGRPVFGRVHKQLKSVGFLTEYFSSTDIQLSPVSSSKANQACIEYPDRKAKYVESTTKFEIIQYSYEKDVLNKLVQKTFFSV